MAPTPAAASPSRTSGISSRHRMPNAPRRTSRVRTRRSARSRAAASRPSRPWPRSTSGCIASAPHARHPPEAQAAADAGPCPARDGQRSRRRRPGRCRRRRRRPAAIAGQLRLHASHQAPAALTRDLRGRRAHRHGPARTQCESDSSDRLGVQADDGGGLARSPRTARTQDQRHRRRPRHHQVHRLAPEGGLDAVAPRHAAYRADVVGEPRGGRALARLPGRPPGLRRGNEPQGAHARHEQHAFRQRHGAVAAQCLDRARSLAPGRGGEPLFDRSAPSPPIARRS